MNCPKCGTPMNRHAEKIVAPRTAAEAVAAAADPTLGGALLEQHACPGCGGLVERLAAPAPSR